MATIVMSTIAMSLDMRKPVESTFEIKNQHIRFAKTKKLAFSATICAADSKIYAI